MKKKRIIIASGGTGGHVFPALALAHQFQNQGSPFLFIGGGLSNNVFFDRQQYPYYEIACAKPSLMSLNFPFKILRGVLQSFKAFRKFKPDLVIGFGSYYTLPALIAARVMRIPYVIHEQNSIPGRVNRLLSGGAQVTAIHFPEAADRLKGKIAEVGMPLRSGFEKKWERFSAKKSYGLNEELPLLLVFGGSQGADAINRLMYLSAPELKKIQILHFTGVKEWKKKLSARYQECGLKAFVAVFEKEMPKAWGAADLVLSRAGAASIAEQIACEVPGILIPYPHAMDQHQDANADYLVRLGGAKKLVENQVTVGLLLESIDTILANSNHMRQSIKNSKKEQKELIRLLLEE